jgi:hypothetical protein
MWRVCTYLAFAWALCLFPTGALAQTAASSIAGTVRDASGGVVPGVTVEASSPALIEKVRSAVTDGGGQYRIVDLRPGTYVVTFTLPGFGTVRREGIELTTGFTAAVNAEMRVGELSETITVSGTAPIVDVQNTQRQIVATREVLEALPTARIYTSVGSLIPGMTLDNTRAPGNSSQEVGGTSGVRANYNTGLTIHGSREGDQATQIDGIALVTAGGVDRAPGMLYTEANFQEIVLDVAANAAEIESGGVRVNMILREGGNTFRSRLFGTFGNESMQGTNMTDALRQRGLFDPNRVKSNWEYNGSLGGPVFRDKLWFFASHTRKGNENFIAGQYVNSNLGAWDYAPDLSRQAIDRDNGYGFGGRATWQATPRNKIGAYYDHNFICMCTVGLGARSGAGASGGNVTTLEASELYHRTANILNVSWTAPLTPRLLLEVGWIRGDFFSDTIPQPGVSAPLITDTGLGLTYRNSNPGRDKVLINITNAARGSIAYVTGTHSMKVGTQFRMGNRKEHVGLDRANSTQQMEFRAVNGVPDRVTYYAYPFWQEVYDRPRLGIFAQDQWTKQRLTMNLGVRYDYFRGAYPDHSAGPTMWVPFSRFEEGQAAVAWHDVTPRLGAAYDLFGNGRTALKVSANKYTVFETAARAGGIRAFTQNGSMARRWTDTNGDRWPQGDALNPAANGELGPSLNLNFGKPTATQTYDPDWAFGFGKRAYNWEFSGGVQHELLQGLSVTVAYFRRTFGNFDATVNRALAPGDFDPYCVTIPSDSRLPGGGGQQICGLTDLRADKVGQADNYVTKASNFGDVTERWHGFDFTMQARLPRLLLQGGMAIGRTTADVCAINSSNKHVSVEAAAAISGSTTPNEFCNYETPWSGGTQVKLLGSYTLPWDVQLATTLQHLPGSELSASATYTSAQVAPSLGRPLAAASTVTVPLVKPGTLYGDRLTQIDMRVTKIMTVGRVRLRPAVDLYNLLNSNVVTNESSVYGATTGAAAGSAWQVPISILPARMLKFTVQADF